MVGGDIQIIFSTYFHESNKKDDGGCRKFQGHAKGHLNSEWIYEVIVCPKIPTKNYRDFCPGSLLEGRAEICNFWLGFGMMTS